MFEFVIDLYFSNFFLGTFINYINFIEEILNKF
jgi:hypothetical protein